MKRTGLCVVFALGVTIAGCAGSGEPLESPPEVTEGGSTTWTAQGPQNYRFKFRRECFCVREAVEPVVVEVREGSIVSVRSQNTGAPMPTSGPVDWYTIQQLLELVDQARPDGQTVQVEFHSSGYPKLIEIGSLAADAGVRYHVSDVERLR